MDEFATELVDVHAVGDSLVMAHVHGRRRVRGSQESNMFDFVMAFRIEDGRATHGMDIIDAGAERFYEDLAAGSSA